jgi:hypothetical protein
MKFILYIITLCVIVTSCTNEIVKPDIEYTLTIDSILLQNGVQSLPIDSHGHYLLKFTSIGTPQSHRVVGRVLSNGSEPYPPESVEFQSNFYWWIDIGDTVAVITESYVNYFNGTYTVTELPPLISNNKELVPTINCCSYSGYGGEINTIIAPIREMVGDTLLISAIHHKSKKTAVAKIIIQ